MRISLWRSTIFRQPRKLSDLALASDEDLVSPRVYRGIFILLLTLHYKTIKLISIQSCSPGSSSCLPAVITGRSVE